MDHPNLSAEINANLAAADAAPSIDLYALPVGSMFSFRTRNSLYTCVKDADIRDASGVYGYTIQGGRYAPRITKANIHGCTWGGSMLKVGHIVEGMRAEITLLDGDHAGKTITTTMIDEIIMPREGRA